MTAYLQPGDEIHIAFGVSATKYGIDLDKEVAQRMRQLNEAYDHKGVKIISFSYNSLLTHPVVVAVFREKA